MSGKGKFEDLEVWQEARLLVNHVYDLSGSDAFAKDFGLRDQIRRAAVETIGHGQISDKDQFQAARTTSSPGLLGHLIRPC